MLGCCRQLIASENKGFFKIRGRRRRRCWYGECCSGHGGEKDELELHVWLLFCLEVKGLLCLATLILKRVVEVMFRC